MNVRASVAALKAFLGPRLKVQHCTACGYPDTDGRTTLIVTAEHPAARCSACDGYTDATGRAVGVETLHGPYVALLRTDDEREPADP